MIFPKARINFQLKLLSQKVEKTFKWSEKNENEQLPDGGTSPKEGCGDSFFKLCCQSQE